MSLDDKLREILAREINTYYCEDMFERMTPNDDVLDESVAQIKQAIADEYVLMHRSDSPYAMFTGQEWYDRFEKEYRIATDKLEFRANDSPGTKIVHSTMLAARKAAGLEKS